MGILLNVLENEFSMNEKKIYVSAKNIYIMTFKNFKTINNILVWLLFIIVGLHYSYSILDPLQSGKVTGSILHAVLECCILSLACRNMHIVPCTLQNTQFWCTESYTYWDSTIYSYTFSYSLFILF